MKRMKYIIAMCGLLLTAAACTDNTPDQPAEEWVISRTAGSSIDNLRMVGKHKQGSEKDFDKKITFSTAEGAATGTWENNQAPTWNNGDVFDLIAIHPAGNGLPENGIIKADQDWQMQYWSDRNHQNRPTDFALTHLLGQLKVHVTVEELMTEYHVPKDVKIKLCQTGTIDYAHAKVDAIPSDTAWVAVGEFTFDEAPSTQAEGDQVAKHRWTMTGDAIRIIPQTLKADELSATLWVEDPQYGNAHYEFFPPADIRLPAGKLTHLYLGITYEHEAEKPTVTFSVTVTDWAEGATINGEATENEN